MKIQAIHREAVLLMSQGFNNLKVAEQLEIAPETVSRWKQDFVFKAELNKLQIENQEYHRDKLRSLNSVALETLESIMMNEENPRERLTAAIKILEITKLKPAQIGSTNPMTLRKEKESDDLLDQYLL